MNNTDKVTAYINDARAIGIEILPPDVNESLFLFNVIENNIRFGMGAVQNVGAGPVEAIIKEREENGPFESFIDFCERVSMKSVNGRVLESLIKVGAFDDCEEMNRKTLIENLDTIIAHAKKRQEEKLAGQVNLFDMGGSFEETKEEMLNLAKVDDFEEKEKLGYEQQLLGVFVSGHPLEKYEDILKELTSMPIAGFTICRIWRSLNLIFRDPKSNNDPSKRNMTIAGLLD